MDPKAEGLLKGFDGIQHFNITPILAVAAYDNKKAQYDKWIGAFCALTNEQLIDFLAEKLKFDKGDLTTCFGGKQPPDLAAALFESANSADALDFFKEMFPKITSPFIIRLLVALRPPSKEFECFG